MQDIQVNIVPLAKAKIDHWVQKAGSQEVSGMGLVQNIQGTLTVIDVFMVKQTNASAETEMDAEALGKLEFKIHKLKAEGKIPQDAYLQFWWHSHGAMGVFWSSTDTTAQRQLGKSGWVISAVFNTKGEQLVSYYQGAKDFYPEIWQDDLKLITMVTFPDDTVSKWDKEYDDNVEEKKISYTGRASVWNKDTGRFEPIETKRDKVEKAPSKVKFTKKATKEAIMKKLRVHSDVGVWELDDTYDWFIADMGRKPKSVVEFDTYYAQSLNILPLEEVLNNGI